MLDFAAALERDDAALPLPSIPDLREPHQWPATTSPDADGPDDPAPADGRSCKGYVNMPTADENQRTRTVPRRWTHIRVPVALAARLDRMAREMERAYSEGRLSVPGEMCEHVAVWFVIANALDEQESRRERSRRPRRKLSP
jgi:hypothetical protein